MAFYWNRPDLPKKITVKAELYMQRLRKARKFPSVSKWRARIPAIWKLRDQRNQKKRKVLTVRKNMCINTVT